MRVRACCVGCGGEFGLLCTLCPSPAWPEAVCTVCNYTLFVALYRLIQNRDARKAGRKFRLWFQPEVPS